MNKITNRLTFIITATSSLCMLLFTLGCDAPKATYSAVDNIASARQFFPSAVEITGINQDARKKGHPEDTIISEIKDNSGLLGFCVESKVVSRSGPFWIRVILDKQFYVKQAAVISYPWVRGRDVHKKTYTEQFIGKGPKDSIQLGKDIDAMTGATISCSAMAEGVRNTIKLLEAM